MAEKENKRKCFKCGCSPATDNVKLFRFPKPAVRNRLRCQLWAQYIFPKEQFMSLELQMKLHTEHRMLCQKHFVESHFTDTSKTKLVRTAVPIDAIHSVMSEACTSQRALLGDITNTMNFSTEHNLEPVPGTSTQTLIQSHDSVKDKQSITLTKCRKYMRRICQLQKQIKKLKSKSVVDIISDDASVRRLSRKLTPTFARLLQEQLSNFKNKSTGRRWSKDVKISALRIFKRSPTCYRLLRRLFHLPSPSTLKVLLNKVPFGVGINEPVFKVLKQYIKMQNPSDNLYTLMFDEMSLKRHLQYNTKDDVIEGYQDHASQGRSPMVAAYALVFMITGLRKRVKQPIAHYFSSGFSTADRLSVLIKEVLHHCFEAGVNIVAIVCDMDGVNRRALTILGASLQHPCIVVENQEIVVLFDPPHLLKCFRNLFMKYDIECIANISSDNQMGRGIAKWSHIKDFYDVDNMNPNFVYCPALKKDHLNPNTKQKMKVKLAAQVLSHSVAGGMYAKISTGEISADATVTANVVSSMDKLFDSLNSDCSDLRRGKMFATNLTHASQHIIFFNKMKKFFETLKYIGNKRKPPSQDGWIWTLNAVEQLWQKLSNTHKIRSLATRRLQQDPLENLFGCIRGNCGSNMNPTCGQFVAGLKTAILSNLSHFGTTGNCDTDNNVIISNFDTLLSVRQPTPYSQPEVFTNELLDLHDIETNIEKDSAEIQACAYVCGFLLKNINTSCKACKFIFIAENVETHHVFTEAREYSEFKKKLNYVTKDMVLCVEHCATLINAYLEEKSYTKFIKKTILGQLENSVNFDFLNACNLHKIANMRNILNSVFIICSKRFCIIKNRKYSEEAATAALKRKMNIIIHK